MPRGAGGAPLGLPPLRHEVVGVVAPEISAPVQHVRAEVDLGPRGHEDGAPAVGPAARRQRRVDQRAAGVEGHHRVQAQRLGEDVLEVGALLEGREGDGGRVRRAEGGEDLGAQLSEDAAVAEEAVPRPGHERGGRVAACGEEAEDLLPDLAVAAGAALPQDVEEVVGRQGRAAGPGAVRGGDGVVDEGVQGPDAGPQLGGAVEPVEAAEAHAGAEDGEHPLEGVVEGRPRVGVVASQARLEGGAVGGEDAPAQHGLEVRAAGGAHAEVGELGGQHGLDVARVGGDEVRRAEEGEAEGVGAEGGEARGDMVRRALLAVGAQGGEDDVDAEREGRGFKGRRAAAELAGEAGSRDCAVEAS
ncbi:DUF4157 domain-containing protein [Colletotrichum higginsianum]|nr:DUF4157 domain-containing protein [Colletotrichum higginsianum]